MSNSYILACAFACGVWMAVTLLLLYFALRMAGNADEMEE